MKASAPALSVVVRPLYANVYLLSSPAGRLVVDSGALPYGARFTRLLSDFQPDAVLLTHAHVDHAGGAWLAARRDVPLLAHPLELPQLTGQVHELPYPAGLPELGWMVVHLPGHTPGQIGVLRDGVLVAADAVMASADGAHLPRAAYNADHAGAVRTLGVMADMDLRAVLPGHGGPLTPEQLRRRAAREEGGGLSSQHKGHGPA